MIICPSARPLHSVPHHGIENTAPPPSGRAVDSQGRKRKVSDLYVCVRYGTLPSSYLADSVQVHLNDHSTQRRHQWQLQTASGVRGLFTSIGHQLTCKSESIVSTSPCLADRKAIWTSRPDTPYTGPYK